MSGCEWNNPLAKENFRTNLKEHGLEYAKQSLRTDIQHWMAKREGRSVPPWKASVDDGGHLVVGNQRLIDVTEAPLKKEVQSPIKDEVKALVPIEMESVRQADSLVHQGAKKIYIPEHAPGGIRFVTVYTQNPDNPREYIGSQIDLGENLTFEEAKSRIQSDIVRTDTVQMIQSHVHQEAFVFVSQKREDKVKTKQNSILMKEVRGSRGIANDIAVTSRRVLTDVASTAISAGIFAVETLRRRRMQQKLMEKRQVDRKINKKKTQSEKPVRIVMERGKQIEGQHEKIKLLNKKELKAIWKEATRTKTVIMFSVKTSIGIHAVLFRLRKMAELPKKMKLERKKKEKRIWKMSGKEKTRRKEFKTREGKRERKKKFFWKESRARRIKKKERAEDHKREKKRLRLSERVVSKKEVALWKMLRRLAKHLEGKHLGKEKRKKFKLKEKSQWRVSEKRAKTSKEQQKRTILRFTFVWIVWMILDSQVTQKLFLHKTFRLERFTKSKERKQKKREINKEQSQWILLAIIWYLVMIREQGIIRTHKNTPQKSKNKQATHAGLRRLPLAPSGVIFALAS